MERLYSLLYDLAFLSFLGLLYYLYQRRKILKIKRTDEIIGPIDFEVFLISIHEDLEIKKDHESYKKLMDTSKNLEKAYLENELENFSKCLINIIEDTQNFKEETRLKAKEIMNRL